MAAGPGGFARDGYAVLPPADFSIGTGLGPADFPVGARLGPAGPR